MRVRCLLWGLFLAPAMLGNISLLVRGCELSQSICGAQAPGDVLIGILLPCHRKVTGLHQRIRPENYLCSGFDLESFMRSLATIHAIEEVNAAGMLPGVRLGYMMCDTCADASKALQDVTHMLTVNISLNENCNYTDFRPRIKIILGAELSEVSIAVARLLNVYMIPLVSTTSSSPELSDKVRFPVFLRTIPNDKHQTKAIAKIMKHFHWDWVGVVYGDDDYGRAAFQSFVQNAEENKVCLAYQEMLPQYLDHEDRLKSIKIVANKIRSSNAQVVLLIVKKDSVEVLLKEMIQTNTTRTWIASDAWSQSSYLRRLDGINKVGDILGFTYVSEKSESFDNYLKNLSPAPGGYNHYIEEYKSLRFDCDSGCFANKPTAPCPILDLPPVLSDIECNFSDSQVHNDDYLVKAVETSKGLTNRIAVWAVANALKNLLNCNNSTCTGQMNFPPWKLLQEMKRVQFQFKNETLFFDKNGDFVNRFDLLLWVKEGHHRRFQRIGKYHVLDEKIILNVKNLTWISTAGNMVPQSKCSENCTPGTVKKILNVSCCYSCIPCVEGTYSDDFDLLACKKCPNGTWSLKGWSKCEPRSESYLRWWDPHPITLMAATVFGVLLLLASFIIFLVYRDSPPMKRAEVRLSCVMMAGLAVSFGSVICFMDKPNLHLCRARQVMYAIGFTLCVSCILVKAYRTFLAFRPFSQMTNRRLHKLYKPPVIIISVVTLQGIICLLWLIFDSPYVDDTLPSPQSMKEIIQCREGTTYIGFGIMLSYIALLALLGFLLAFKGRKVPQEFSETGYIIFSMLMYLFVWVCFVPVYITNKEERTPVHASAILVSSYGIIFCHFIPKCHEALWGSSDTLERILKRWRNVSCPSTTSEPVTDIDTHRASTPSQRSSTFSASSSTTTDSSSKSPNSIGRSNSGLIMMLVSDEKHHICGLSNRPQTTLRRNRSMSF
ncbi:olfactory receptor CB1 [Aulostomus maculatus]